MKVRNCVLVALVAVVSLAPVQGNAHAGDGACCGVVSPCVGDIDGDGSVNVSDLLAMLAMWGPCPGCAADINGDGSVNVSDLLALLAVWGPCPAPTQPECAQLPEQECTDANGVFLGEGIDCANVVCAPVAAAMEFRQLDFVNAEANIPFSNWGSLILTYESGPVLKLLNLSVELDIGAPAPSWQIQNMPLSTSSVQGKVQTLVFNFDLGNDVGEQVLDFDYGISITENCAGMPIPDRTAFPESSVIELERGEPGEPFVLDDPLPLISPCVPLADGRPAKTEHKNEDFPNQLAGKNECVPVAVSNSLQFLNAKHGMNMPAEKISIAKMKEATGWDAATGAPGGWWNTKDQFMQENGYQIETIVVSPPLNADKIMQITDALDANHDIEIGGRPGHRGALTGLTKTKDVDDEFDIVVTHDRKQEGPEDAKDRRVNESGKLKLDGTIEGITWMHRGLINFVIERPLPDDHVKTPQQIAKTLDWARMHLLAVANLMTELLGPLNGPDADPEDVANAQNEALSRLGSAIKLIGKAIDHLQAHIDAGGGAGFPPVETMQQFVDALSNMLDDLALAHADLANAITNPDITPEQKKKVYSQVRDTSQQVANNLTPIINCLLNPADCPKTIPAGDDCYQTICGDGSHINFGDTKFAFPGQPLPPIPPGFFDPGSDPFVGVIQLGGNPSNPEPDTLIRRLDDVSLEPPLPAAATVPIEIVALDLVSCQPITVTFNGGENPQQWDVRVELSEVQPSTGQMQITLPDPSVPFVVDQFFDVVYRIEFIHPPTKQVRILDFGASTLFDPVALHSPNNPALSKGPGCAPGFAPLFNGMCCVPMSNMPVAPDELNPSSLVLVNPECPLCDPDIDACPGDGDCCAPNGTPGCHDEFCCAAICADDPFCCDVEWDQLCAKAAMDDFGPCAGLCK